MEPAKAKRPLPMRMSEDSRSPRDDFFCWRFQVWYPSEDCVYRHANKTYHECTGCFQGRLNLRHIEKGARPPVFFPPGDET